MGTESLHKEVFMKPIAAPAILVSFVLVAACTPAPVDETAAPVTGPSVYKNIIYKGSDGPRGPSSIRDYVGEIEQATGKKYEKWLADEAVVDAKARMEKIFQFARNEPQNFFAHLRRNRPILASKAAAGMVGLPGLKKEKKVPNIYLVTRYKDVKEVLDNYSVFSVRPYADIMDATVGHPYMLGRENTSANREKPGLHGLVDGRGNAAKVRAIVAQAAREALREGARNGRIDVVKSVSRAVPIALNEQYFGFHGPSPEYLYKWSRATQHAFFHNPFKDEKVNKRSVEAGNEMRAWISGTLVPEGRLAMKNGRPSNTTVQQILEMSQAHRAAGLSDDRVVANIVGLLVGSVETTSAAIAQSLEFIMNNPEVLERARAAAKAGDTNTISRITWEALRFDPVNPWLARYSEEDFVLARGTPHETLIPKGSLVLASTESAMWDEDVFTNPTEFDLNRDARGYMHLGYGYHRCLGDDVSLVMVPETIRQILLLPGVRKPAATTAIDQAKGPFPESYELAFDQTVQYDSGANESTEAFVKKALFGEFVGARIVTMEKTQLAVRAIRDAFGKDQGRRAKAIEALPGLVENALATYTEEERVEACMEKNPKSKTTFPDEVDRRNYCALPVGFRACYFVQRLVGRQSSFTSYYHCAYNREFLTPAERHDFKAKFAHMELFSFLNFEQEH